MEKLKSFLALIGGMLVSYFGQNGKLFCLVAAAIALDLVSGIAASICAGGGLSSRVAGKGVAKKFMGLLAVVNGTFLDAMMPFALSMAGVETEVSLHFSAVICAYVCLTESISVAENFYRLSGNKMPKIITNLLTVAKEKMEE